jgi:hypothetical protein
MFKIAMTALTVIAVAELIGKVVVHLDDNRTKRELAK